MSSIGVLLSSCIPSITSLILVFATVVALFCWKRWNALQSFKRLGIPGPKPNFIYGNLKEIRQLGPVEAHRQWFTEYGDVYGIFMSGRPVLVIKDREMLKEILIKRFDMFSGRPPFAIPSPHPQNKILPLLNGEQWKHVRKTMRPTFTAGKLKLLMPLMNEYIDVLVEKLNEKCKAKETAELFKMYQSFTLDTIGAFGFGLQCNVQRNKDDPFYISAVGAIEGFNSTINVIASLFQEFHYIWLFGVNYVTPNKGMGRLSNLCKEMIAKRLENKGNRRVDVLQLLLDAAEDSDVINDVTSGNSEKKKPTLAMDEIIAQCQVFFLAGYDTTSRALGFVSLMLAKYREVQNKVYTEINDVIGKDANHPTYEQLAALKYLDMVIMETLRIYPPAPNVVSRAPNQDCEIGNYKIPKGMHIEVPVLNLHHDAARWPEPETFKPERFADGSVNWTSSVDFMPFGLGQRHCIAMRFGILQMKAVVVRILQNFRLGKCPETNNFKYDAPLTPSADIPGGVHVKLEKRNTPCFY